MTGNKTRIRKLSLLFAAILLLLTFFSHTIDHLNQPHVSVAFPESGAIARSARGQGVVSFAQEDAYYANASGSIYPLVKAGDAVEAGAALYTIVEDVSQLEEALEDRLHTRDSLALRLAGAEADLAYATGNLQDAAAVDVGGDRDIARVELALRAAQEELTALAAYYDEQAAYQEEADEQALDDLYAEYRDARAAAEDEETAEALYAAYQRDRERLEDEQEMAAATFAYQSQQALDAKRLAVDNLYLEYQQLYEQKQNALAGQGKSAADLQYQVEQVQLEVRENEREIAKLREQISGNGRITVTAESGGLVSEIHAGMEQGAPVSRGEQILRVGVSGAGFATTVSLPETVDYIAAGDTVLLTVRSRGLYNIEAEVAALSAEQGRLRADIRFQAEGLAGGEAAEVLVEDVSMLYENVLPSSAVREDSEGEYVLYVEKVDGMWQDEYYARRMYAMKMAENSDRAAVIISSDERLAVIVNSDKAIAEGDRVRIVSGSELLEIR